MAISSPTPSVNRIRRELIDVRFYSKGDPFAERKTIENLCAGDLTAELADLLDSWAIPHDQLICIDRIQVDVKDIRSSEIESELVQRIVRAIRTELKRLIGPPAEPRRGMGHSIASSIFQELLFFLEHGYLPWPVPHGRAWQAQVERLLVELSPIETAALLDALREKRIRQRFIQHFPDAMLSIVLPWLRTDPESRSLLVFVAKVFVQIPPSALDPTVRAEILELSWTALSDSLPGHFPFLREQVLERVRKVQAIDMSILETLFFEAPEAARSLERPEGSLLQDAPCTSSSSEERTSDFSQSDGKNKFPSDQELEPSRLKSDRYPIYLNNGGLIILAPYLPSFFDALGLARGDKITDPDTALLLLHYLVFGVNECAEYDLALPKILCGIPLEEPLSKFPSLSPQQENEAEKLLESVIKNWSVLKNTSVEGLRSAFLQREGALRPNDKNWRLLLSRKSYDVLLDQIPWTIWSIRLPWMPYLLQADWIEGSA
jgi:hypothetical protein